MSDDNDSGGASSVILAFLLGGMTGAALAILYAPRSGREAGALRSERLRETAGRGGELRDTAVSRGRDLVDEATGYVDRQRDVIEQRKERFAAAVEAGRQAYREE